MLHRLTTVMLLLLVAASAVAEVYKWVDDDGVVHYSDQPTPGAERIELPKSSATPRRATPPASRPAAATPGEPVAPSAPFSYKSLGVTAPAAEQTLWNIAGTLNVTLSLEPGLRPGDRVRVYYDGNPQLVDALNFQLQEVWRGEHNLQAEVLDSTGKLMIRSKPIRFFVQQTTILN